MIGAGLAMAASAGANQIATGWFSNLFSPGGNDSISATSDQTLLTQADAAMNAQMDADAKNCDEVGIGSSIKTAIGLHTTLASATPNVESLFDVSDSCFASVSQLADLSFAIPSLGSILSAAQSAVVQYAQKKVCSAVSEVSSMVTAPINQAISNVNTLGTKFSDINGMSGSAVAGSMAQLDPQLGAEFKTSKVGSTYTINMNPYSAAQTTFQTTEATTTTPQATPTAIAPPQSDQEPAAQAPAEPKSWWGGISGIFN